MFLGNTTRAMAVNNNWSIGVAFASLGVESKLLSACGQDRVAISSSKITSEEQVR
jgi:hypothetical protein